MAMPRSSSAVASHAFSEVDPGREAQLVPCASDGEAVLPAQELHAVPHDRWRFAPACQAPESLGSAAQRQPEPGGNVPGRRGRTQLGSDGSDVIALRYRLIVD